jgi:hypothetical protein
MQNNNNNNNNNHHLSTNDTKSHQHSKHQSLSIHQCIRYQMKNRGVGTHPFVKQNNKLTDEERKPTNHVGVQPTPIDRQLQFFSHTFKQQQQQQQQQQQLKK